jgi:ATP/maltotriose-dependent transcriptional regulator MalT
VDTGGALSAMRDLTDQFVGDEIYNAIPEQDRPVIDLAALLPDFDATLLERAGFDAALATFESVSRHTAILRERVPGVYDCHPVFQDFLVSRIRHSGAIAARALHVQAARALESALCLGPALEAYTLAGSTLDVLRIIETHGFELVDRGFIDPLVRGIALLDPAAKRSNPRIVALRGLIYSFAGKRPRGRITTKASPRSSKIR